MRNHIDGACLSRRTFLSTCAAGAMGVLGMQVLAGCSAGGSASGQAGEVPAVGGPLTSTPASAGQSSDARVLTVFFSMPETDDPNGMTQEEDNSTVVIDGTVFGNVQYMANTIQETVGGDVYRIEAAVPYTTDHEALVDQASEEKLSAARPALLTAVPDLSDYDVVFFGYPIWWTDFPMVVYTFLEEVDMAGKVVVPFTCHGGSGFAGTRETLAGLQPNADVLTDKGLSVSRNSIQDAGDQVATWAQSVFARL